MSEVLPTTVALKVDDIFNIYKDGMTDELKAALDSRKFINTVVQEDDKTYMALGVFCKGRDETEIAAKVILRLETMALNQEIVGRLVDAKLVALDLYHQTSEEANRLVVSYPVVTLETYEKYMNRVGLDVDL